MSASRTRPILRLRGALAAAILISLAGSCLERPVVESLEIRFAAGGGVEVAVETGLSREDDLLSNPRVAERIETAEREILAGLDAWSLRFADLEAERETLFQEREKKRLTRARRTAVLSDPESLRALFAGSDVSPVVATRDDVTEFALYPSGRPGATEAERQRLRVETDAWISALSDWLAATSDLYGYLDAHPDRARHVSAGTSGSS